jgi:hypothetical protein
MPPGGEIGLPAATQGLVCNQNHRAADPGNIEIDNEVAYSGPVSQGPVMAKVTPGTWMFANSHLS